MMKLKLNTNHIDFFLDYTLKSSTIVFREREIEGTEKDTQTEREAKIDREIQKERDRDSKSNRERQKERQGKDKREKIERDR